MSKHIEDKYLKLKHDGFQLVTQNSLLGTAGAQFLDRWEFYSEHAPVLFKPLPL